jgi:hypothetical protein
MSRRNADESEMLVARLIRYDSPVFDVFRNETLRRTTKSEQQIASISKENYAAIDENL